MINTKTLNIGDIVTINGMTGYFNGLKVHGFSSITGTGNRIIYEGFKDNQYFKIESLYEYGYSDYEVLEGDLTEEETENIIEWINNPNNHIDDKVYQQWYKTAYEI
jgi:signal peptidase I